MQSAVTESYVAVDIRHLMNVSVRLADAIVYRRLSAAIDTRAMYLLGGGWDFYFVSRAPLASAGLLHGRNQSQGDDAMCPVDRH